MTWIRTGICAALLLVSGALPSDANTTVSHFKFKNDTAVATFDQVSASDPCLENLVFIFASDEIQKISPGPKSTTVKASLVVTQVDSCTGIPLFVGEGETDLQVFSNGSEFGDINDDHSSIRLPGVSLLRLRREPHVQGDGPGRASPRSRVF